MDVKDLTELRPQVEAKAEKIREEDRKAREHLESHQEKILPLTVKPQLLHDTLWYGKNPKTNEPLLDDQVVPTIQEQIDTSIKLATTKIENPYNEEDLHKSKKDLGRLQEIKQKGKEGLISYCQSIIDHLPRQRDTGELSDGLKLIAERYEHYQQVIGTRFSS